MLHPAAVLCAAIGTVSAFSNHGPMPLKVASPHRLQGCIVADLKAEEAQDTDNCLVDEPMPECVVRKQIDGPWADVWARYVLLRPGMSYRELKEATLKRNQLDPRERIPGTARTVVLTHLACFLFAVPVVLSNEAVLPKLVEAAAIGRLASGVP